MQIFVARKWRGSSVIQEKKIKAKDKKTAQKQFEKDNKLKNGQWVGNYWHIFSN